MANVGTHAVDSNTLSIVGIPGTGDNVVVMELDDASRYNEFTLMSTAGAMDVDVSLDGTNFATAIAINDDESLTPATKVIATVAGILYSFRGNYKKIRVQQKGATAAVNASMICGRR